jgi:hypothetical protein
VIPAAVLVDRLAERLALRVELALPLALAPLDEVVDRVLRVRVRHQVPVGEVRVVCAALFGAGRPVLGAREVGLRQRRVGGPRAADKVVVGKLDVLLRPRAGDCVPPRRGHRGERGAAGHAEVQEEEGEEEEDA